MKTVGNILWLVFAGLGSAIVWLVFGALLTVTIVGLPFSRQCLKLARFSLWPFGYTAVRSPTAVTSSLAGNVVWVLFAGI